VHGYHTTVKLLVIVIVEGFPEADPDVEQTQAGTQAAKKTGGDQGTKPGIGQQKIIVGPLGGPGQDHEQDAGDGANQHEKENGGAVQQELYAGVRLGHRGGRAPIADPCAVFGLRGHRLGRRGGAIFDG